jgi:hypothetical protein
VWEGTTTINGLAAKVTVGGPTGMSLYGDLVLGEATLRELLAAWGRPEGIAVHSTDDFVAAYSSCRAGFPIVIKFDQPGVPRGAGVELALDEPLTSVLVAYADGPPDGAGCN